MKNILVVITTGFNPYGGLTTVMMNYWRAMDKTNLHFDFACTNDPEKVLLDEVCRAGCNYIKLPPRKKVLSYCNALRKMSAKYDVAHVHGNSATSFLELVALSKVPVRIVHNHNSITEHPFINAVLKPFFLKSYTQAVACSELAGDWLFGKGQFKVLRNAIDVARFKPNSENRKRSRQLFGFADGETIIGNVGKIIKQKNHSFIIDVFAEYHKINPKSKLLLIGTGNIEEVIREKIIVLGLEKFVVMAGLRMDIPDMMCAMDVFLFPSLWEGLPLAALEAQASGLPVFLSDVVSSEVAVSEECFSCSLNDSAEKWARFMDKKLSVVRTRDEILWKNTLLLDKAGFNIALEANELRKLYCGID